MTLSGATLISLLFIILGVALVKMRKSVGEKAAIWYKKLGIEVPEELYTKQFAFIGVMLMIVGFLGATGLLAYL
ncbi:MAG: hypothetical protein PVG89_17435 [Gammaproteobacteria bacterium]|jgi:hypothetical protein